LKISDLNRSSGRMIIENREPRGGGKKSGKCFYDRSTLDAVSGISKIGLSAVLHFKVVLDDGFYLPTRDQLLTAYSKAV